MMVPDRGNHLLRKTTTMGDKNPKAAKKQADQKRAKNNQASAKKQQAITAKQLPTLKKK